MTFNAFDQTPLIIGHRGAAGLVPENTLPSFERAVELGVAAIELDIHRCQDTLVVIHDDTLERTTNGRGAVTDTPLETLRRLDAGNGAAIPLLDEVFTRLPVEIGINIELKGRKTADMLARWLPSHAHRSILISSFDHQALEELKSIRVDCALAPLFGRWQIGALETALGFGSGFINLSRKLATQSRLEEISAAGLKVLVYTVNELEEARRFFELGVWGVFTDYPDRISTSTL